jgi:serine protease Do
MLLEPKSPSNNTNVGSQILRVVALSLVGCLVSCFVLAEAFSDFQSRLQAQVVKVNAERSHGTTSIGSAVIVGGGKLITNCHVVRWAESRWATQLAAEDLEHDLCVLGADALPEPVTDVLGAGAVGVGQEVFAAGYPGGREFNVSCGKVKALHEHDGARVIRTSAPFSPGASGGGLFDAEGRLLGVLTFRAVSGGDFHFVMPVEWVKQLLARAAASSAKNADGRAFWERSFKDQPYFLQAAAYEEGKNWSGLLRLAKRWILAHSGQPESWMAVGKACTGLGRFDDAAMAFRNVLTIDPAHSEGQQRWDALAQRGQSAANCAPNSWCDVPLQAAPEGLAVADLKRDDR